MAPHAVQMSGGWGVGLRPVVAVAQIAELQFEDLSGLFEQGDGLVHRGQAHGWKTPQQSDVHLLGRGMAAAVDQKAQMARRGA
jgi:hypothetical protein